MISDFDYCDITSSHGGFSIFNDNTGIEYKVTVDTPSNYWPTTGTCVSPFEYAWQSGTGTATVADIKYLYNNSTTSDWKEWNTWSTCWSRQEKSSQEKIRDIIRDRLSPAIHTRRKSSFYRTNDVKEIRARETLRRILGDDKFNKYVKDGFVSVRAKSGLVYQIFPGHDITNVYDNGKKIERLCVVLSGSFPPTDQLIMRYLLILNDERDFRSHAINHNVIQSHRNEQQTIPMEPLTKVWDRLRTKAA